jgi:hypothetical protein
MWKNVTNEELNQLAIDYDKDVIFSNRHIRKQDVVNKLQLIFMSLFFMNEEQVRQFKDDPPGLIYEYMERSLSIGINGYPIFPSCRVINKKDTTKLFEKVSRIRAAKEKALAEK